MRLRAVFLSEQTNISVRIHMHNKIVSRRKHTARSASHIQYGNFSSLGENIATTFSKQNACEQTNYFTRGIVIARRRIFRKAGDDFLEHITHLDIVYFCWVQFKFRKFLNNAQQTIVFVKVLDFFLKLQFFENCLYIRREGLDIEGQILYDGKGFGK